MRGAVVIGILAPIITSGLKAEDQEIAKKPFKVHFFWDREGKSDERVPAGSTMLGASPVRTGDDLHPADRPRGRPSTSLKAIPTGRS